MVNFPTTYTAPSATAPRKASSQRRIVPSSAADKRETRDIDRRLNRDRRGRRGSKQVMDRRSGPERRRSTISFSV
ncbi:hypothetical protein [Oceanicoccus sagamiensis]|uniref:Uncharacterized protein n=1 Tax=Oceanicoccus sagamiensis TaxID=716816 RepID=A0A1X9NDZ0_9GAMM|nr:hypothetical protein [Oceanicoccus sagamiensis]ARN75776.1 hypothetical protein BST96_17675 [Oceanicoccus sagamiensis]